MTYELSAILSDNVIGDFEPMDDVLNEFGCLLQLEVGDGPDFDPLGEFVNGDQEVIEALGHLLELLDHVEAPDHKRSCDGNSLECLGQWVALLGIVLASLAGFDEVLGVSEGSQPVKAVSRSLSHKGAWHYVVPSDSAMDIEE